MTVPFQGHCLLNMHRTFSNDLIFSWGLEVAKVAVQNSLAARFSKFSRVKFLPYLMGRIQNGGKCKDQIPAQEIEFDREKHMYYPKESSLKGREFVLWQTTPLPFPSLDLFLLPTREAARTLK